MWVIIHRVALRNREIMHLAASTHPSVRLSVCLCPHGCTICRCVCNVRAYTDDSADAVDQLLIEREHSFSNLLDLFVSLLLHYFFNLVPKDIWQFWQYCDARNIHQLRC